MKFIEMKMTEADDKEHKWRKREADVARVSQPGDTIVSINARGTTFEVEKSTLMTQVNSLLANTFSGAHALNEQESIRIKSNPEAFTLLIDYLVYGKMSLAAEKQQMLDRELHYWGIEPKQEESKQSAVIAQPKPNQADPRQQQEQAIISRFPGDTGKQLKEMLERDPKQDRPGLKDDLAAKWRSLGPLSLVDILEKAEGDFETKYQKYDGGWCIKQGQLKDDGVVHGIFR